MLNLKEWYGRNQNIHENLLEVCQRLIITLLEQEKIKPLQITYRVKTFASFSNKIRDKKYVRPEDVADLAGLRIIAYTISDVKRIEQLVEKEFHINTPKENKQTDLGKNIIGYISTHYIVSFAQNRLELSEYRRFKNLKVEVQIRTILQHAWAEIEHNLNYKSDAEFPVEFERKINLLSALLEIADNSFQQLIKEYNKLSTSLKQKIENHELDVSLNPISLGAYFQSKESIDHKNNALIENDLIEFLRAEGIDSISKLDDIVKSKESKYRGISKLTDEPFYRIALSAIYNERDKMILKPKFLKSLYELADADTRKSVDSIKVLKNTDLRAYAEGIIPYVTVDLRDDGFIQFDNYETIRITTKGIDEVKKITNASS